MRESRIAIAFLLALALLGCPTAPEESPAERGGPLASDSSATNSSSSGALDDFVYDFRNPWLPGTADPESGRIHDRFRSMQKTLAHIPGGRFAAAADVYLRAYGFEPRWIVHEIGRPALLRLFGSASIEPQVIAYLCRRGAAQELYDFIADGGRGLDQGRLVELLGALANSGQVCALKGEVEPLYVRIRNRAPRSRHHDLRLLEAAIAFSIARGPTKGLPELDRFLGRLVRWERSRPSIEPEVARARDEPQPLADTLPTTLEHLLRGPRPPPREPDDPIFREFQKLFGIPDPLSLEDLIESTTHAAAWIEPIRRAVRLGPKEVAPILASRDGDRFLRLAVLAALLERGGGEDGLHRWLGDTKFPIVLRDLGPYCCAEHQEAACNAAGVMVRQESRTPR